MRELGWLIGLCLLTACGPSAHQQCLSWGASEGTASYVSCRTQLQAAEDMRGTMIGAAMINGAMR